MTKKCFGRKTSDFDQYQTEMNIGLRENYIIIFLFGEEKIDNAEWGDARKPLGILASSYSEFLSIRGRVSREFYYVYSVKPVNTINSNLEKAFVPYHANELLHCMIGGKMQI